MCIRGKGENRASFRVETTFSGNEKVAHLPDYNNRDKNRNGSLESHTRASANEDTPKLTTTPRRGKKGNKFRPLYKIT